MPKMSENSTAAAKDDGNKSHAEPDNGSRIKLILTSIHVEPFVCCYIVSRTLLILATQNLSLQKACRVNLNLSNDTCWPLENPTARGSNSSRTHGDEVATQRLVANMLTWQLVVQSSVPCVLAILVGSWSDRNRKRVPCMLLPMASELVRVVGLLACVYYFYELPMEAVGVMEAVPTSLAGGRMVLFNALFSYVADVTNEEFKTLRIGIVNLLSTVGMAIGTALSGITFRKLGFYGVYSISSALYVLGILYGLIFIKEVSSNKSESLTKKKSGCFSEDFFNASHVKEAFVVTFKEGPNNRKTKIMMLMIIAFLIMGPLNGDLSVSYLNTRARFNWNEVDFSVFSTYSMITMTVGTAICIGLFSHILKIDDGLIGVMACTGKCFAGFCYAFATVDWVYYMGPLIDVMGGTIFITARSIMSKIVESNELGQVTAIYSIVESLVPIFFGPLYSVIYKYTVNTHPGAYSLIGSILAIPAIIIYLWIYKESKNLHKYNHKSAQIEKKDCEEIKDLNTETSS